MQLDSLTLMVPDTLATTFAGLLLFGAWLHFKDAPALGWWAAANVLNGVGLAALTAGLIAHSPLIVTSAVGVMTPVPALIWGGVRRFNRQHTPRMLLAAGTVLWLAICLAPFDLGHQKWSTLANFASWFAYLSAAIWSLLSAREEELHARWPLAALLAAHATMFFGAGCEVLSGTFAINGPPRLDTFFGAIHFESILYSMGTAIFMVLMCKERVELGHITAARIDGLTGTSNRGSFFEDARRVFGRCRQEGSPFSLIMFDLDRFKSVNDTFGHQAGDRLLQAFAESVRTALRPNDLVGRYGGEEFIVVLPGATVETAYAIAERVRVGFAQSHRFLDGHPLNATVSAGIAMAPPVESLDMTIAAADKAMYVAKRAGRNRVERAPEDQSVEHDKVVRVA